MLLLSVDHDVGRFSILLILIIIGGLFCWSIDLCTDPAGEKVMLLWEIAFN
ncbi:hypothetical protein FIU95_14805 [Microbulbifer sp. THAF38]|nr:hypothetical protein FIU95_14805 [Microbulbifer sp. THAF38]